MFWIKVAQIILALLLMLSILFQNRESGLSGAFGGSGAGSVKMTKRGADKVLFIATIVLAILFFGLSVIALFL